MTDDKKVDEVLDRLDKKKIIRFCKDCKYSKREVWFMPFSYGFPNCIHPNVTQVTHDLVHNRKLSSSLDCRYMRENSGSGCGPDGNLFEPK